MGWIINIIGALLLIQFAISIYGYICVPLQVSKNPWTLKRTPNCRGPCEIKKKSNYPEFIKLFFRFVIRRRDYVRYFLIPLFLQSIYAYYLANRYGELNSHLDHDGIIIVHENIARYSFYGNGISILINFFRNRNPKIAYRVYHCENLKRFFEIVRMENVTTLWIFGHGNHAGIGCGTDYIRYEDEFLPPPATPGKKYVYQFHCNCGDGKSLADILSNGRGFVDYDVHDPFFNQAYIKQILKEFT